MDRSRFGQGGLFAAGAAVAVAAVMAVSGADGARAAADHGLYARDASGPCYSTSAARDDVRDGRTGDLAIATGDSVTWHIDPPSAAAAHNAAAEDRQPADPNWQAFASDFTRNGSATYTFTQPGDYKYVCQAHANR